MTIQEEKKKIRKEMIRKRAAMEEAARASADARIFANVCEMTAFAEAKTVFFYVDYHGEVRTREMMAEARRCGKVVGVPRVSKDTMEFFEITGPDDLESGMMGILEPKAGCRQLESADLMIMPGVAFDKERHRLGYGGGYYDRYLENHAIAEVVAVAYEIQIAEALPQEESDKRPDRIITENGRIG